MLKLPLAPDLLGTSAESLNFIVSAPPDPAASVNWGLRHGITHPDVMQSLDLTARHWQQKVLAAQEICPNFAPRDLSQKFSDFRLFFEHRTSFQHWRALAELSRKLSTG